MEDYDYLINNISYRRGSFVEKLSDRSLYALKLTASYDNILSPISKMTLEGFGNGLPLSTDINSKPDKIYMRERNDIRQELINNRQRMITNLNNRQI